MATVWELVQEYSTAPIGSTFWEHLNAQEGGGVGGGTFLVSTLNVELIETRVEVEVYGAIHVELIDNTIELEIEEDITETEVTG